MSAPVPLPVYTPLIRCPSLPNKISFAAYWYRFTHIENYWICSRCYEDYLSSTFLARLCERFYHEPLPGTSATCDFNNARTKQFLQLGLRTGCAPDLLDHASKRSASGRVCAGVAGETGGRGLRWWSIPEVDSLVVCDACYEYWICATALADKFYLRNPADHQAGYVWICDLASPYVRRELLQCGTSGRWRNFTQAARHFVQLPSCGNSAVKMSSRKWFRPTIPYKIDQMMVCEACFLNYAGGLSVAQNFGEVTLKPQHSNADWICDFQVASIAACSETMLKQNRNYDLWHRIVSEICSKPFCARGNIKDGIWYTLPDPDSQKRDLANFDICAACYAGFFKANGFDHLLRLKQYPVGCERLCDFSPAYQRSAKFMEKWMMVLFTGSPDSFVSYAKRISNLPLCQGWKSVEHQRWYGMDAFLFCQACYEEAGRGTYFAPFFNFQNRECPSANCDMHADDMRCQYMLACRERNLEGFLKYAKEQAAARETHRKDEERRALNQGVGNAALRGFIRNTPIYGQSSFWA